jgi:predicted lipoprotein with Yx(FWY)xxD motif
MTDVSFRFLLSLSLVSSVLIAAGCGSSKKSSSSATSQGTTHALTQATTPAAAPSLKITTKHAKGLGTILAVGSTKLSVYLFEADRAGHSNCSGACAKLWPPVTGTAAAGGAAMSADLGTITRSDGTTQVTYHGHPLYYYSKDKDSGDAYGQGLKSYGASWYVLAPSGKKVDTT